VKPILSDRIVNRPLSKPISFVRLRRCADASDAHLRLCIWILRCALNDSYAVNCRFGSFARLAFKKNTWFRKISNACENLVFLDFGFYQHDEDSTLAANTIEKYRY